jgi:two-component system, NarL family, nitrate/nitrite response regulator NarL
MSNTQKIRLMLVVEDREFLDELCAAIETGEGSDALEIVGVMTCGKEALSLAEVERPHVVMLDMDTKTDERIAAVPSFARACNARVLMLATLRDTERSARALKAGARGIVLKRDARATVRKAVLRVNEGELWLDRQTTGRIIEDLVAENLRAEDSLEEADGMAEKLTARELEVVRALLKHEGAGSRDLAARLHVSEHTLRNHFTSIYRKLGVPNRTGLFAYASRLGLGRAD